MPKVSVMLLKPFVHNLDMVVGCIIMKIVYVHIVFLGDAKLWAIAVYVHCIFMKRLDLIIQYHTRLKKAFSLHVFISPEVFSGMSVIRGSGWLVTGHYN